MKIALFPSAFHPSLGGVEELVRQLAHELVRQGHEVIIVTNRWPRNLPRHERFEGLDVFRFPTRIPIDSLKSKINYRLTHRKIVASISRLLRDRRVEVVNAHCVSCVTEYAMRSASQLGLPTVVTLQGELTMDPSQIFQKRADAAERFKQSLRDADVVTAVSGKTLSDAEAFSGFALGSRGRVIFNGANGGDFEGATAYRHGRPYVYAMGRLVAEKGFDLLLEAVAKASCRDYDLLLAGSGPLEGELATHRDRLGLSDRVHLIGRKDHAEVVSLLLGAEAFVLPSRADEGLPVVIAEALTAGCPIVATRSGGTPEVIEDGVNGLLLDRGDLAGLRRRLDEIMGDAALRARLQAGTRAVAPRVQWPTIARQYVEAYRHVVAGAGGAAGEALRDEQARRSACISA
jgi:glycosyltransferase involved in cell wall biosynthesis